MKYKIKDSDVLTAEELLEALVAKGIIEEVKEDWRDKWVAEGWTKMDGGYFPAVGRVLHSGFVALHDDGSGRVSAYGRGDGGYFSGFQYEELVEKNGGFA